VAAAPAAAALAAVVAVGCGSSSGGLRPVGIVSSVGIEQAPILARMHAPHVVTMEGYRFYVGTIGGKPIVSVYAGEEDESVLLATHLLAGRFHPRALVFSGTAGSQSPRIDVGDVVLGGVVVNKSNVHYELGGYQSPYSGVEVPTGGGTDLQGAQLDGYGSPGPTPANARRFAEGDARTRGWAYVQGFAADRTLVALAERAPPPGTATAAQATGEAAARGTVANRTVLGVVGQAHTWTEPLSWVEAQNRLYQSDAEENEGTGFAFAGATAGIPWLIVRGISDTPWHPNAYAGALASRHAAGVAISVATHASAKVGGAPVRFADLSPVSNARRAGYLVADRVFVRLRPVTGVVYTDRRGRPHTLSGKRLKAAGRAYTYGANRIPPSGAAAADRLTRRELRRPLRADPRLRPPR
jgi:adenosylhomocysteine nucleosidase